MDVLKALNSLTGKVAVVGSMNADLTVRTTRIPGPGETVAGGPLQVLPGGKSANQAVCAAKLGASVSMIGALGNDSNRSVIENSFVAAGVNTRFVQSKPIATGTAVITVDQKAENTIVVSPGANGLVDEELVLSAREAITAAGALGLCLEVPFPAVRFAAQMAREAGVPVVFNLSPILPIAADFLSLVDVLIVNEHELSQVLALGTDFSAAIVADALADFDNISAWRQVHSRLQDLGVSSVIVTLGAKGSIVLPDVLTTDNPHMGMVTVSPCSVEAVDTTGCGDSYMAAILAAVASGWSLVDGAQLATYVSAYAARGEGAQNSYGWATEISDFFA